MPVPIDFKKLFRDTTKYPDNFKLKIGDDEVELGVLRTWNAENGNELVKELETQRAQLAGEADKIDKARREVANLYLDVEEKRKIYEAAGGKPNGSAPPDPYAEFEADPIAGGLAKLVREQAIRHESELKAIKAQNQQLLDGIGKMGLTYMGDRTRSDYGTLASDPDFDPKDGALAYEKLYEHAVKNKFTDPAGIPDVKKAYKDVTQDKRVARLVKEAEDRGEKRAAENARMNVVLPKPSGARPAGLPVPDFKDLDGALAAASQDKSIWAEA